MTFNRLTKVKATNNSSVTVPIEEFKKIEAALSSLQENQSFSFWLIATMNAYVRESGFVPPDEALFTRLSNSLSLAMVDQARSSFALSACMNLTRRAHFLKFAQSTVSEGQKCRLMATSPFSDRLFYESTLGEVIKEYEGAAATTSHLDLSKAVAKGLFNFTGKRKFDDSQANPGSPLVPHATPSTSKASAASMFNTRYQGKDRGQKKGGGGAQRGGKSAPASQKPAQDFAK